MSSEAKVGIFVIIALALCGYVIYVLAVAGTHRGGAEYHAIFGEVQALQPGAPVRMAGVDIGEVTDVKLTPDNRARVTFRLEKQVPLHENYRVTIGSGALLGETYLDIAPVAEPGRELKPGERIIGTDLPRLQDLVVSSQRLVTQLETTVGSVNEALRGPEMLPSLKQALDDVSTAAAQTAALTSTLNAVVGENRAVLNQSLRNLQAASEQARRFTEQVLPRLAASMAPGQIEEVLGHLSSAAEEVAGIAEGLREIAQDPALAGNIRAILENVRAASADITEMTATLKQAAENVRMSSESFRETTETVRETSVTAQETVEKVRGIVDRADRATRDFRLPRVGVGLGSMYLPDANRTWSDIGIDIGYGDGRSALLGLADIGETDRLNFQLGRALGPGSRLRYGIVESKIGLGWDRAMSSRMGLTVDLFDPNDLTANLLGYYHPDDLGKDWDLVFGVRRLFEDNYWAAGARTRR